MKKNVFAMILSFVLAVGSVGAVPVFAAEEGVTEEVAVEEQGQSSDEEIPSLEEENFGEDSSSELNTLEEVTDIEQGLSEDNNEAIDSDTDFADTNDETTGSEADFADTFEEESVEFADAEVVSDMIEDETEEVSDENLAKEEGVDAALAGNVIGSGTCGDNATWTVTKTDDGMILTIDGKGSVYNYSSKHYTHVHASVFVSYDPCAPWIGPYRENITTVVVKNGITGIGNYAFYEMSALVNVQLPESVTSIGDYAFNECSSLTDITIPDSVTNIGDAAFWDCSSLTDITIPKSIINIGTLVFGDCTSLKNVTISNGVTYIEEREFCGCSSLENVTIPASVTNIEYGAFYGCRSLKDITIPASVTSIGKSAFGECSSLENVTMSDGVTSIDGTFSGCSSLKSIVIPESVTNIGNYAFDKCSKLRSIVIPDNVTNIGYSAFGECVSLESIVLSENTTSIGGQAFLDCTNLKHITIPESVTSIGRKAFYGVKKIYFKGDVPAFDDVESTSGLIIAGFSATVYYPVDNSTWTESTKKDQIKGMVGGSITWKSWDSHEVTPIWPANGAKNVDHTIKRFNIRFNHIIDIVKEGSIRIYDASYPNVPVETIRFGKDFDQKKLVINPSVSDGITELSFFTSDCQFKPGHEYYILIDPDCIGVCNVDKDSQELVFNGTYSRGITNPDEWRFTTCALDYMHFGNQTKIIQYDVYRALFLPLHALMVSKTDNGENGTCYGWAYTVGAKEKGYLSIEKFRQPLYELETSTFFPESSKTLLEYIQLTNIYQYTSNKKKERSNVENEYDSIYAAIRKHISGEGPKIIVNVGNGNSFHAIYPLAIYSETSNEIQILTVNANESGSESPHYIILTLKKDGNGFGSIIFLVGLAMPHYRLLIPSASLDMNLRQCFRVITPTATNSGIACFLTPRRAQAS